MQYRVPIYKAEYVLNITLLGRTHVRLTAEADGETRLGPVVAAAPRARAWCLTC